MTVYELYQRGCLGIQLMKGIDYLDIAGTDENGEKVTYRVEANRIYAVTYLSPEGVGMFQADEGNSVVFRLDEPLWVYTSTYSGVLH